MGMPIDLVLLRHGNAEGNAAAQRSKAGDHSGYTNEFRARPGWKWRLTDLGRKEAVIAGAWIKSNMDPVFDAYLVSPFIRPRETAGLLGLPGARWRKLYYLCERNWGALDSVSYEEKMRQYRKEIARKDIQGWFWSPPDGDSMAVTSLFTQRAIDMMWREYPDKRVIIASHGERMWTFRFIIERMTLERYEELDASKNPVDRIHNCQIIWYTRRDPNDAQFIAPHYRWMRSVCPWDLSLSTNDWQEIEFRTYSNEDLLLEVEQVPRLIRG